MIDPSLNQYAPPQAEVADVAPSARTAELKLFSAQGRIGRLRYLAYGSAAGMLYNIAATALTVSLALRGGGGTLMVVLSLAMLAVLLWFSVITGIKRCHDIGISGWWSLTLVIPLIVFAWLFWPGDSGENRFGPPPPPNTWGVRLLGAILPLVFFLGIVAAIAIPQYKAYTDRAKAAQSANPR